MSCVFVLNHVHCCFSKTTKCHIFPYPAHKFHYIYLLQMLECTPERFALMTEHLIEFMLNLSCQETCGLECLHVGWQTTGVTLVNCTLDTLSSETVLRKVCITLFFTQICSWLVYCAWMFFCKTSLLTDSLICWSLSITTGANGCEVPTLTSLLT